jgi:hypothetical protein
MKCIQRAILPYTLILILFGDHGNYLSARITVRLPV